MTDTDTVRTASWIRRLINLIIDIVVFRILTFLLMMALADTEFIDAVASDPTNEWLLGVILFLLYYFLFETAFQKTPAKFITGTRVVMLDGSKPPAWAIAKRTLIRLVPFEPFSISEGTWWHDRWTDTLVVTSAIQQVNQTPVQVEMQKQGSAGAPEVGMVHLSESIEKSQPLEKKISATAQKYVGAISRRTLIYAMMSLAAIVLVAVGYILYNSQLRVPDRPLVMCAFHDTNGDGKWDQEGLFALQTSESEAAVESIIDAKIGFGNRFFGSPAVALSPTGKFIAYNEQDGTTYLVELGSHQRKKLTTVERNLALIFWSPDGQQVAIETGVTSSFLDPYMVFSNWEVFDTSGSISGSDRVIPGINPFSSGQFKVKGASFEKGESPNGKFFAFGREGIFTIRRMRMGSDSRPEPTGEDIEIAGNFEFVNWSPNSKQILVWIVEEYQRPPDSSFGVSLAHGFIATLFVMNSDGSGLTQLSTQGEVDPSFLPIWSPDGNSILYGTWLTDGNRDGIAENELPYTSLIMMAGDGSNRRELLDSTYYVTCTDW